MGQHQQEIVAGGALKRILLVLSVAALMAVVMSVMAAPAFAIFLGKAIRILIRDRDTQTLRPTQQVTAVRHSHTHLLTNQLSSRVIM